MQLLKAVMLSGICSLLMFTLIAQRVTAIPPESLPKRLSQESMSKHPNRYKRPEVPGKGFYLSLAPLALADFTEPSMNLHFMYATSDKLAFGLEAGYIYHYPTDWDPVNGFRLRPEVRFKNILTGNRLDPPWYLSIQGMFKYTSQPYDYDEIVQLTPTVSFTRLHSTHMRRKVVGLNLLIGEEYFLRQEPKHLFLDWYMGMGFRYRIVDYADGATKEVINSYNDRNSDLRLFRFRDKTGAGISLLLGLRAGWKF